MARTTTKAAIKGAGARTRKKPAPKPVPDRVRWDTMVRSDLLLGLRKLALDRDVSPYVVLDDAVEAFLKQAVSSR